MATLGERLLELRVLTSSPYAMVNGLMRKEQQNLQATTQYSVEAFKSYFSNAGDMATPERFDVLIDVPDALVREFGLSTRDLIFQCAGAELPGKEIRFMTVRHNAFPDHVPRAIEHSAITLEFVCRADLLERRMFTAWLDLMINDNQDNWRYGLVKYKRGEGDAVRYDRKITIQKRPQTPHDAPVTAISLVDAMPTMIGRQTLSWADTNAIMTLPVTFIFRSWRDEPLQD